MTRSSPNACPRRGGPVFWTGAGMLALMAAVLGTAVSLADAEASGSSEGERQARALVAHVGQLRDPLLPSGALDAVGLPFGDTELFIEGFDRGDRVDVVVRDLGYAACVALPGAMGPGRGADEISVNGSEFSGPNEFGAGRCVADRVTRWGTRPANRVVLGVSRSGGVASSPP